MSGSRSSAARATLGLPDNFKAFSAFPLKGMNQSASRIAMEDSEAYWIENFIKVGDGNYRTTHDSGSALYTSSGANIVYFFFYNIGAQPYAAIFLSDGTAVQVAYPSGAVTTISSAASLFYVLANGQLPVCVQSGTQFLLIANHNTQNDYWIWDGSLLYGAGGIAPFNGSQLVSGGSGYTSVPSYTVFGGHGSGVVLTPVVNNGSVISLTVTNPGTGYLPGDVVQVGFSGGGSDTTPILTASIASGVVQYLTLVSGGSAYPTGTFPLGFSGGGGTGAQGTFTTSGGSVTSVSLTNGGSGYTSTPTVTFPFSGSGGSITANLTGTSVSSLTIATGGSGYTPGTYPLSFSGGGGGSGAQATYTVNLSGVIASYTLVAGGTGYLSAPTVNIPTGTGAAVVAGLSAGAVTGVTVTNGGTNLHGTPTLTFQGGGGTGAAATAVMSGGAITSVTVTNGGTGYTSAPAVLVQTAVNNSAAAILSLMPFGVSGTSMETFQGRLWIGYPNQIGPQSTGGVFYVSGPGSLTNFATSLGGDIFTNTDRFLRQAYTFLRQTSNFMYAAGDSSVSVISNVQTSGNPSSTTFSYQNADPQIGTSWRDTAQDFGNTILFANVLGVFGIYGGSIRKVSKKMDRLFTVLVPPSAGGIVPTAATANIYTQKIYLLLCTIVDPFTFKNRNVMMAWDGDDWTIATQTPAITYIGTQEYQSNLKAWGTDGTHLYPLFQTPSSIPSVWSSKFWGGAQSYMINMTHSVYIDAEDVSTTQAGIQWYGTVDADGLAVPVQNYVTAQVISCPSGSVPFVQTLNMIAPKGTGAMYGFGVGAGMPQVPGVGLGLTLATSSLDVVLRNVSLGYIELTAVA